MRRPYMCGLWCLLFSVCAPSAQADVAVLNSRDATVTLLDQTTYQEISTFPMGKEQHHLMSTPDHKSMVVANALGDELVFLDPKTGQIQRRGTNVADPY